MPAIRCQQYPLEQWESLRPTIRRLYLIDGLTANEICVYLAKHYHTYTKKEHIEYRLIKWRYYKNDNIRRRPVMPPNQAGRGVSRHLSSPGTGPSREGFIEAVRTLVQAKADEARWVLVDISEAKIVDMWNWSKNSPTGVYRALELVSAGCYFMEMERPRWSRYMLHESFKELNEVLSHDCLTKAEEPTQSVQIIFTLLAMIWKLPAWMRKRQLQALHDIANGRKHPYVPIISRALIMNDQGHYDEECQDVFHAASASAIDILGHHYGNDATTTDLCKLWANQLLRGRPMDRPYSEPWIEPNTLRERNREYFWDSRNIEKMIVRANEFHDFEQLLQIQDALEHIVSDKELMPGLCQMITGYLEEMKEPIDRMRCRDYLRRGDAVRFKECWQACVGKRKFTPGFCNMALLNDLVLGLKAFVRWNENEEVEGIITRLRHMMGDDVAGELLPPLKPRWNGDDNFLGFEPLSEGACRLPSSCNE